MAQITAQVIIPATSEIPADAVINTFAFGGTASAEDLATFADGALSSFYNGTSGQAKSLSAYLGRVVNPSVAQIKMFDIADPLPRQPIFETTKNWAREGSAVVNLPREVALCVSFAAAQTSGSPAGRRRGRIYLGPLSSTANAGSSDLESRPAASILVDARVASLRMAGLNTPTAYWGVYSRRDNTVRRVWSGWVDNAWDTQRRRGVKPNSRSTWDVAI